MTSPGRVASDDAEAAGQSRLGHLESAPPDRDNRREGPSRLRSLDAARGWAIVVMLAAGNPFQREHLWDQLRHPQWHGLTFADLFFPLFLFTMGVAMMLSRRAGSPRLVLRRVALLLVLGIALSSFKHERLFVTGVLQHIAGAYLLAWLILRAPRRMLPALTVGLLLAVWIAYLLWAGPGQDPWGGRGTFAHAVDGWLLGGFKTEGILPTVTSTISVLGGALVGRRIKEHPDPRSLLMWVGRHAAWLIAAGLLMAILIPINKRLWTPSFTVLSLGTSCAWFALLIWLIDLRHRRWLTPLQELGANPIAVYVAFMAVRAIVDDYRDAAPFIAPFGSEATGTMLYCLTWLLAGWYLAHQLVRKRVYVKL
jgi:predicted acyltransferase